MSKRTSASRTIWLSACLAAAWLGACQSEVISVVEIDVEVLPPSITLTEGDSAHAAAVVRERGGVELSGLSVTWTVDNPEVATVSADGLVEGRAAGFTTIRASSGDATGSAQVRVWDFPSRDEDCFICLF